MYPRILHDRLQELLVKPYGGLLFGARQVGKTTLLSEVLKGKKNVWEISLQDYEVFQAYLKDTSLFKCQALARLESASKEDPLFVFIDEVQKIPHLLDECQLLYDKYKDPFRFFAMGSSARKLRRAGLNLLPGRSIVQYMHPLTWAELGCASDSAQKTLLAIPPLQKVSEKYFQCEEYLIYGTLPGILSMPIEDRKLLLKSYAQTYLKEEIQAEALVRSLDGFFRFLELAALESGNTTNYQKLGKNIGLKTPTVKNYYTILVDTMVAISLEPYLKNARKRLISTPKIYFFDTGVRNAAAALTLDNALLKTEGGRLFEHFVVLEIYRRLNYFFPEMNCYYWRTSAGAEVDLIIDTKKGLIPIEIKYTTNTTSLNVRSLRNFMTEYQCEKGYVVGCFRETEMLDQHITALPWWIL